MHMLPKKFPSTEGIIFLCIVRIIKFNLGGDEGDRTPDLLNAIQALSQLSYAPNASAIINVAPPLVKKNFI